MLPLAINGMGSELFLEQGTRREIYDHVRRVPGVHLRQLQRDLDIPMGTLEYHLHQMEKRHMLVTRNLARLKAYFASDDGLDRRDRDILYFLRQAMPRHLALLAADDPGISFRELTKEVPIAPSTVSFHLKKLVEAGILREARSGREKVYDVLEPERIRRLVTKYRGSFVDDVVDRFASAWLDIGI